MDEHTNGTIEPAAYEEPAAGIAPEAPADDAPLADSPITIKLRVPIQAHGEEVQALTLRPMNPEDLARVGYPARGGRDGTTIINAQVCIGMIARLASVPESSIKHMHMVDYHAAFKAMMVFFDGLAPTP